MRIYNIRCNVVLMTAKSVKSEFQLSPSDNSMSLDIPGFIDSTDGHVVMDSDDLVSTLNVTSLSTS